MAYTVQFRRGTTAEHSTFTGEKGEVTFDTTTNRLVVHDGTTVSGIAIAKLSDIPTDLAQLTDTTSLITEAWQAKLAKTNKDNKTLYMPSVRNMSMSDDGTKVYTVTQSYIYGYDLSIPFDLSTAVSQGAGHSYVAMVGYGNSHMIEISGNGEHLYVAHSGNGIIYQLNLSTPYDITTATNASKSVNIGTYENDTLSMEMNSAGTKMWTTGGASDEVHQFTLSTPYDITSAAYDDVQFNLNTAAQITTAQSVVMSTDGSKMYVFDSNFDELFEFDLSTAYDIGTATYNGLSTWVQGASHATMSADGSKLYASEGSVVVQYSLTSTTDDIVAPTASSSSWVFDMNEISTDAKSMTTKGNLAFSKNGTKMYSIDTASQIKEYDLSIAYDIGSATYNHAWNFTAQLDYQPTGVDICRVSPDGTKLYILQQQSNSNKYLAEWTLNTPWDITSVNNSTKTKLELGHLDSSMQGLDITDDGTKLITVGTTNDRVYEFVMTTPYDLSTAYWTGARTYIGLQSSSPSSIKYSNDGTKLYMSASNTLYEYTLSTPFAVATANISSNIVEYYHDSNFSASFSPDGKYIYFNNGTTTFQYRADGSAYVPFAAVASSDTWVFDKTSIIDDSTTLNVGFSQAMTMSPDGTKLYGINSRNLTQYSLSTPYDIGSATYVYTFDVYSRINNRYARALEISSDGTKMYVAQYDDDKIYQFTLSTPYSLSTISSYPVSNLSISNLEGEIQDMTVSHDGQKMFIVGSGSDQMIEYVMSTPFSIATSYWTGVTFDVSTQTTSPRAIQFSSDGMKVYIFGSSKMHEYLMTGPYSLPNISYVSSFDVGTATNVTLSHTGSHMYSASSYFVEQYLSDGSAHVPVVSVASGDAWVFDKTSIIDDSTTLNVGFSQAMSMSADGTKLYGINSRNLIQYSLSTPYDIGSAAYAGIFDVYSRIDNKYARSIEISNDGTKMYVGQYDDDKIFQFTLSTPFALSSISNYPVGNISVSNLEGYMQDMTVSHDGKKMFIVGSNSDQIIEYVLSTPFQITSAYWTGVTFDVSTQAATPVTIKFSSDGMKVYMYGNSKLHEYSMTTAYNLSTATFTSSIEVEAYGNVTLSHTGSHMYSASSYFMKQYIADGSAHVPVVSVASGDTWVFDKTSIIDDSTTLNVGFSQAMSMSADGTKMYGINSRNLIQYSLSTPYDIGTATFSSTFDVYSRIDNKYARSVEISSDGSKIYVGQYDDDKIYQFTLSTLFALSSISSYPVSNIYIGNSELDMQDMTLSHDGKKMFIVGSNSDSIIEYALTTPFSISSAYWTGVTFDVSAQTATPVTIKFNSDGMKVYIYGNSKLHEYSMTTAYNLSTASFTSSIDVPAYGNVILSHTGSHMYSASSYFMKQYLSDGTAHVPVVSVASGDAWVFDKTSIIDDSTTLNVGFSQAMSMSSDGTKLYGINSRNLIQYSLSTPYDIGTATFSSTFDVYSRIDNKYARSVEISSDGSKIYVGQYDDDKIYQFTMSTPYSLSTISSYPTHNIYIGNSELDMQDMTLSHDGKKMFIVGSNSDSVIEYVLSTPNNIASAYWTGVTFDVSAQTSTPVTIKFSSDGMKFHVYGNSKLHEYSMTTAYNLSTATFTSSIDVPAYGNVTLSHTGLYMYSASSYFIKQYIADGSAHVPVVPVSSGDAWVFDNANIVHLQDNTNVPVYNFTLSSDGTKLYGINSRSLIQYSLSTPYDITTATSTSTFDVYSRIDNKYPRSLEISSDGSKIYVGQYDDDKIYQFTMSTPYSLSTISSYPVANIYVGNSEGEIQDMALSHDGQKMFIVGSNSDSVNEYVLSTPFNIASAYWTGVTFNVSIQSTFPTTISFSNDGNSFYIAASGYLYEYAMTSPYDLSTAAFVSTIADNVLSRSQISNTGTYLYSSDGSKVSQYTSDGSVLAPTVPQAELPGISLHRAPWQTANYQASTSYQSRIYTNGLGKSYWVAPDNSCIVYIANGTSSGSRIIESRPLMGTDGNLGTVGNDNSDFNPSSQMSGNADAVKMSSDKTKLYISDTNKIYQYTLSTPGNLDTAAYDNFYDVTATTTTMNDFVFSSDGTDFYVLSDTGITQFTLSVAWDVTSTVTVGSTFSVTNEMTSPYNLGIVDSNNYVYVYAGAASKIFKYTLGTAKDIATASLANAQDYASATIATSTSPAFFPIDGKSVIIKDSTRSFNTFYFDANDIPYIDHQAVSASLDVSLATYDNVMFEVTTQDFAARDITFKTDGTQMYMTGDYNDVLYQYSLSTPWDLSTASYANKSLPIYDYVANAGQSQMPAASTFNADGSKVYITGRHYDKVHQYSLSTPWDISTGSFDSDFSVAAQDTNPTDMIFYDNGTKMLIIGYTNAKIYQYSLSVGYDISTAAYDNVSYSVSSEDGAPGNFAFSPDGTQMFMTAWYSTSVKQYDLSTAYDITTLSFTNTVFDPTAQVTQNIQSVAFSSDGAKMYLATYGDDLPGAAGGDYGRVYQYSTNGNFASSSSSSVDFTTPMVDLNKVYDYPMALTGFAGFIDNGNKFVTFREDDVYVHTMSIAYDITSVTTTSSRSMVVQSYYKPAIKNVSFSSDGNYMYIVYNAHGNVTGTADSIWKWSLSTAFNISSTLTSHSYIALGGLGEHPDVGILDLKNSFDMKKFYVLLSDGTLCEFGDLSSAPGSLHYGNQGMYHTGYVFETGTVSAGVTNITVGDDGTKIYLHGTSGVIYQLDLSRAFDLSTATYNDVKTDSSAVTSNPINRAWIANDGSRYATLEYTAGKYGIHLYSMNGDAAVAVTPVAGPAWSGDITTSINSLNKTFSYNGMTNDGLCGFADNGNRMITLGGTYNEYVYTHNLSTPYDISTKTGTTTTFSRTSSYYKPAVKIAKWSTDGSRLYTVNDNHGNVADSGYLTQRNATTPFNGNTATGDTSYNARISSNEGIYGTIQDFTFAYDGSKMYVLTGNTLYENILTTPWEINTSYWSGKSYDFGSITPQSVQITDDGTKIHVSLTSYTIREFDLGTAFDISTITDSGVTTGTIPGASNNAWISNDGSRIIAQDFSTDRVVLYSINGDTAVAVTPVAGPAWSGDITTSINSLNKTFSYNGMTNDGLCGFAGAGNYVVTLGGTYNEYVHTHNLSTPYDISTRTGNTTTFSRTSSYYKPEVKIAKWSTDGSRLYTVNNDHGNVADSGYLRQRNATTPFNGNTATGDTSYNGAAAWNQGIYGTIQDFAFSYDGSKMYVLTGNTLYENILNTPWEITTSYWSGKTYEFGSVTPQSIQITDDGTKMHVSLTSYTIREYSFGTAFDILTLTNTGVTTGTIPGASNNAWISNDGSRIIAQDFSTDRVISYSINGDTALAVTPVAGPAWSGDITNDLNLGLKTFSLTGLTHFCGFADNGNHMITLGGTYNEYVYTHNLSTPYDISTRTGNTTTFSRTNSYYKPEVKIAKWSTDGSRLYTVNDDHGNVADSGYVRQRNATTPFNGNTATGDTSYNGAASWNQGIYGSIQDFAFSHDGKKLYVLLTSNILYENILTTPWEITTSYWSGKTYDFGSMTAVGIQITDDGTKMHVRTSAGTIRELDFGTAFDILTLTDNSVTSATIPGTEQIVTNDGNLIVTRSGTVLIEYTIDGSVASGISVTVPAGYDTSWNFDFDSIVDDKKVHSSVYHTKFVSNDGTKLYQINSTSKIVYQYELSIAHDISSAISGTTGQSSKTLSNLTDYLYNVFVSPDGINLYAIDFDNKLYHYTMSTPHDLSTATYTAVNSGVSTVTQIRNIEFNPDGSGFNIYYAEGVGIVRQYVCPTPWDISTAYWTGNSHVFETSNTSHSFQMSADGTKAYTFMREDDIVREYTMSGAWDISTMSSTPSNTHNFKDAWEVFISPDGSRAMASTGTTYGHIYRTDGSSHTPVTSSGGSITWAGDIASLVDANKSFNTGYSNGWTLSDDGTKLYTMNGQRVDEHTLSIAHDISSASFDKAVQLGQSPLSPITGFVNRIHINSAGTKMFVLNDQNPREIYQYDFGTPFDVATLTKSTSPRSDSYFKDIIGETSITGFAMSYDGKKLFHTRGDRIVERVLETAFDITTEYKTGNEYWTGDIDSSPQMLQFSSDGLKLYAFGATADSMFEFTMTTAYDISTMSYNGTTKRVRGGALANLSSDGTKMYVLIGTTLHQYDNS